VKEERESSEDENLPIISVELTDLLKSNQMHFHSVMVKKKGMKNRMSFLSLSI
jgi:hypothetical protein